ncbi:phospholipase B-like protein, partial [Kipferlia bialata]
RIDSFTDPEGAYHKQHFETHCTAMVKPIPGDVVAGHTTWTHYGEMDRIYKHYRFNYSVSKAVEYSFSSKFGYMFSKDDFWVTSMGLVIMETTNSVHDQSLYDNVTPKSLLTWQRCAIASRMAGSAQQWVETFAKHFSGTYSNQWMALSPMQGMVDSSFWVYEETPGFNHWEDMSATVRDKGYWPSYNIPYFKYMQDVTGYTEMCELHGSDYCYDECPRATIFQRDALHVTSLEDIKDFLRYNDWQNDPLSLDNPANQISARYDLRTQNPSSYGGIDSKATSGRMASHQEAWAQSGPSHDDETVFCWSDGDVNGNAWTEEHVGQPDCWDMDWEYMSWNGFH